MDVTTWTAIGAVATAVTAVMAIWTLWALRQDSRDRTRPVMVAILKQAVLTRNYELHIVNLGSSVAKNIQVTFEPELPNLSGTIHENAQSFAVWSIQRRYEKPIPSLPPGQVFDNLYQDSENNDQPVPDTIIVSFSYRDDRNRKYFDKYELSTYVLGLQTGAYPSTDSEKGMNMRLVKAIESIARGLGHP